MESIISAVQYTCSTFIIAPLMLFCFLPVWQDAKNPPLLLAAKAIAAFAGMETIIFFIYLMLSPANADAINTYLVIVVFFFLYQREFALERSHLWFIFMTACMIGGFIFLIYTLANILLNPTGHVEDPPFLNAIFWEIAVEVFLILILAYPAKKYLGWLVHNFHEEKIWKIIWLIPFGFMIFSSIFIPYDNSVMYIGRFLYVYILTILVLFSLIIFIYVLFYNIARSIVEYQKIILKTASLEIQAQQYHRLQTYMQETSRLRHDFRYQLTVLAEMLKKQQFEELEDYLEQYIASVSDIPIRYCTSSAVNAILNHYAALCRELTITAHLNIRLRENFSVEDIDFCVLLGNLLENAIDGCKSLPECERRIVLKVGQTTEYMVALQISNPYEGSFHQKDGRIFSSKREGEGQGLKSVQMIAEKYNGDVQICHENQQFEVKILLYF